MSGSLAQEIETLRAENAYLKETLASITSEHFEPPGESARFTPSERRFLNVLFANVGKPVRRSSVWQALFSDRQECDWPSEKIVDVYASKVRKKLARHRIEAIWGVGYRIVEVAA